ncbi:MAG: transposase zinc-binding domain-containing protein [Proteobacteria bacterium]|nr:transposase zinc-binding domain-containing protein [Pseudomonadota bacterium]MBU1419442.1 transposase zinc-binding domain-containing protein [Pseudomonadota bacterium]MBU1454044.1 transposase zinc-binding domain-containing protein [Pseudomonadota bacterium]
MELPALIDQFYDQYIARYGDTALPGHLKKALNSIHRCRTPESGELYVKCPDCAHAEWRPVSCGNQHCPRCQNHNTNQWIDKQQRKLLPVPYVIASFDQLRLQIPIWNDSGPTTIYSLFKLPIGQLMSTGTREATLNFYHY